VYVEGAGLVIEPFAFSTETERFSARRPTPIGLSSRFTFDTNRPEALVEVRE
jgi:hypothetical protein